MRITTRCTNCKRWLEMDLDLLPDKFKNAFFNVVFKGCKCAKCRKEEE